MKRIACFLIMMLAFVSLVVGQDTTSVTIDYVSGQSIIEVFTSNWQAIALLIFAIIEFYLGKTTTIKSNSIIQLIIDLIKKLAAKQ